MPSECFSKEPAHLTHSRLSCLFEQIFFELRCEDQGFSSLIVFQQFVRTRILQFSDAEQKDVHRFNTKKRICVSRRVNFLQWEATQP